MTTDCPHDSMSGDEGPVALLGRMPVRWRCDSCEAIVYDDVNPDDEVGPDWPLAGGGKDSYRYEAVQALRGDLSLFSAEREREREQWQDVVNEWADAYALQSREFDRLRGELS